MEKELIHKDCDGEIDVELDDDGACGDPECCGSPSYHIVIHCKKCGKRESIY